MTNTNVSMIRPVLQPYLVKKKVAAYARVSVEGELPEHSLATQVSVYRDMITSRSDWDFAGVYADMAFTGTKADRPGFRSLLSECEKGGVDIILVKSISRFARNTVDLLSSVRRLKELGISVRFERERIDTMTFEGELMITLLASFAQEESRSVSENTKWLIRKRFEAGIGNEFVMYGYRWNGSEFTVVPEQAEVVRTIYSDYLSGMTPHQIAGKLSAAGVPSTRGGTFSDSLVWKILRLEKYRGDSLLQKTFTKDHISKKKKVNSGELPMYYAEGTHPQIIDDETYDAVQEEIKQRAELGYLANQSISFSCFTGKVICGNCGRTYRRRMSGMRHRIHKDYKWICGNKIEHTSSFCSARNVPERILYSCTSEILQTEEFSKKQFDEAIEAIIVNKPRNLTFRMRDGREISKTWLSITNNTKIREAINGSEGYVDTRD